MKRAQEPDAFNVLTNEKARGGLASFISGALSNAMNAGLIFTGVNPILSTVISLQILGNLLTYFLDIMMAKRNFHGVPVSYRDLRTRFDWFVKSFNGPPFHKFIVACVIEAVIVSAGLIQARLYCDRHNIHFHLRDAVLAGIVASISFVLVMNILRFNWVLNEAESVTLNIVVLAWMGLSVLVILVSGAGTGTGVGAGTASVPEESVNLSRFPTWQ